MLPIAFTEEKGVEEWPEIPGILL